MAKNAEAEKAMLRAIAKQANKVFTRLASQIRNKIALVVRDAVYNSPEMMSVRAGKLKFDFGLTFDPTIAIANAIADSCEVFAEDIKVISGKITGGLRLNIQPQNYLNVLNLPQAVNVIEDGSELPWLEWLTLYGNQIIIVDFGVKYVDGGRTGGAIMVEQAKPFRVDPNYSGSEQDNFISRAITKVVPELTQIIQAATQR
jgi:hypothetical protein